MNIPEESLKTSCTCFNDYDKFAVKRAALQIDCFIETHKTTGASHKR